MIQPSPPPFQPKGKSKKKPAPKAKVIKAPKEAQPAAVKLARVTAGPFFDDRHPRTYEGWTVVIKTGEIFTYHRFRTEAEAQQKAAEVGR